MTHPQHTGTPDHDPTRNRRDLLRAGLLGAGALGLAGGTRARAQEPPTEEPPAPQQTLRQSNTIKCPEYEISRSGTVIYYYYTEYYVDNCIPTGNYFTGQSLNELDTSGCPDPGCISPDCTPSFQEDSGPRSESWPSPFPHRTRAHKPVISRSVDDPSNPWVDGLSRFHEYPGDAIREIPGRLWLLEDSALYRVAEKRGDEIATVGGLNLVRVYLLAYSPPPEDDGTLHPVVILGVGQETAEPVDEEASPLVLDREIPREEGDKYLPCARLSDNVYFHILTHQEPEV